MNNLKSNYSEQEVNSFEDFETEIQRMESNNKVSVYFRGQSDIQWKLKTTLERELASNKVDVNEYYQTIKKTAIKLKREYNYDEFNLLKNFLQKEEIDWGNRLYLGDCRDKSVYYEDRKLFEGKSGINEQTKYILKLENGEELEIRTTCDAKKEYLSIVTGENKGDEINHSSVFNYMIFLRHHGFPSPILEWSSSQYIAAFFALIDEEQEGKGDIAIFMLKQSYPTGPGGPNPYLVTFNKFLNTTKRHFVQQCFYTVCIRNERSKYYFVPHEEASNEGIQVVKYIIKNVNDDKVLEKLKKMNISHYSMYDSVSEYITYIRRKKYAAKKTP